ncbi:MAG: immunity protein 19 [Oscillospiraceae bacterium]|nr:immunity protein 19 [Oscillospiraceae bacterium]
MKKVMINSVSDNKFFWLYFLSSSFPNALSESDESTLSEFMFAHYDYDKIKKWVDDFVQYTENIIDDCDGYVDEPTTLCIVLNENNYQIAFHPGDTIYYLNGGKIGCTGPSYEIQSITWNVYCDLIDGVKDTRIALLLLPVLNLDDTHVKEVKNTIFCALRTIDLNPNDFEQIASMIINGIIS